MAYHSLFELFRHSARSVGGLLAVLVLTAGCANQNSIFRNSTVSSDRPRVITEDAKQRNTYIVPDLYWPGPKGTGDGKAVATNWRICAEAAPDVFTALSTSAGADVGFNQTGTDTEAAAKMAIALSEAAGTIERTQTINLLRESMYRTCERYLGGAIGRQAFVVQAGRDWRAMMGILAIEQLTRAARPAPTIIAPASTGATITSPSEMATELRRAAVATEDARIKKEGADKAVTDANCPAAEPGAEADQAAKDKWGRCVTLKKTAADAVDDLRRAEAAQTALSNAVTKAGAAGGSVGADTGGENSSKPGGGEQVRSATDLQVVAFSVERIVMAAFNTDETQLFCLQSLSPDNRSLSADAQESYRRLQDKCMEYLMERIETEKRKLGLAANFQSDLELVLAYVGTNEANVPARWQSLLAYSGVLSSDDVLQVIKDNLAQASSREAIQTAFSGAGPAAQAIIAKNLQAYR